MSRKKIKTISFCFFVPNKLFPSIFFKCKTNTKIIEVRNSHTCINPIRRTQITTCTCCIACITSLCFQSTAITNQKCFVFFCQNSLQNASIILLNGAFCNGNKWQNSFYCICVPRWNRLNFINTEQFSISISMI